MNPVVRRIFIFSALPAAVAFAWWHFSSGQIDNRSALPAVEKPPSAEQIISPSTDLMDLSQYAEAGWGRDPFVRPVKGDSLVLVMEAKPQWILGGILYDDKAPTAVINQKIVSPGDTVNGARVVEIKRRSVTLEIDSVAITLDMARGKS